MIDYQYKAKDKSSGRTIEGVIQADSEMAAGKLLLKQDLYPLQLKPKKGNALGTGSVKGKVKAKDRVVFTRQLATLIKAGLPVSQALNSCIDQVTSKKLKDVVFRLARSVEGGTPLSQALSEYPENFNRIYISMVQAGEASGTMDTTLERLALQQEKDAEAASKIRGAMIYPLIVMLVIIIVMGFMVMNVVPQVAVLYKSFNKPLPWVTAFITGSTSIFFKFWYLIIPALGAIIYGIYWYFRTPAGRLILDRAKITMPPINTLFNKLYMARFARTLSSLVASGIPILEALRLVSESMNNMLLQKEVELMAQGVKSGRALSETLNKTEYFLPLVGQMVKVGEDSGTMGDMLDRLATFYENEVDQAIKNISTIIEPVMIVFLGLMVAIMIVGILYPVYNLVGADLTGGG